MDKGCLSSQLAKIPSSVSTRLHVTGLTLSVQLDEFHYIVFHIHTSIRLDIRLFLATFLDLVQMCHLSPPFCALRSNSQWSTHDELCDTGVSSLREILPISTFSIDRLCEYDLS